MKANRSTVLRFKVRESEKELFQSLAQKNDMTLSDYIRRTLMHSNAPN